MLIRVNIVITSSSDTTHSGVNAVQPTYLLAIAVTSLVFHSTKHPLMSTRQKAAQYHVKCHHLLLLMLLLIVTWSMMVEDGLSYREIGRIVMSILTGSGLTMKKDLATLLLTFGMD